MNLERLIVAWNSCFTTPGHILISLEWLIQRTLQAWKEWTEKIRISCTVWDSDWVFCFYVDFFFFLFFLKVWCLKWNFILCVATCILCEETCIFCRCCKLPLDLLSVTLLLPLLNLCWCLFASLLQISFFGIELYRNLTSVAFLTPNRLWASWCRKYSWRTRTRCVLSWSYSPWLCLFHS